MAIHKPGQSFRRSRIMSRKKGKRDVTAILSLTAMVDMFTVLVIFLLQSYNTTGAVIYIPKEVSLPKAESVKDSQPAHVVTISNKQVYVDKDVIVTYDEIVKSQDWMLPRLYARIQKDLAAAKLEEENDLKKTLQQAVNSDEPQEEKWNKVTIQADKSVDFLTVKKVMYTIVEAGSGEINFAVLKETVQN